MRCSGLLLGLVVPLSLVLGCSDDAETAATSAASSADSSSSSSGSGGAGGGGTGGSAGVGGQGGEFTPACVETSGVIFAIDELYLGNTDTAGTKDSNAWMQFGKDIDGLTSTAASTDVCKPNAGGSAATAYPDGNAGIDNSFGKNVLPQFLTFSPDFPASANASIDEGSFSIFYRMDDIAAGDASGPFLTRVYGASSLGAPPNFDGEDCWPVLRELMNDPADIDSTKIVLADSVVAGNIWSSGTPVDIQLTLPSSAGVLNLTVRKARISMDLAADHKGAINGQLGGVLDTEAFVTEIQKLAGGISPIFCSGPIVENILTQVRQASDIMNDGTQDPSKTCNGISIGLGFTAKTVKLGGVDNPAPPPVDPCAPME